MLTIRLLEKDSPYTEFFLMKEEIVYKAKQSTIDEQFPGVILTVTDVCCKGQYASFEEI